jgi:hypothetical protein
MSFARLGCSFPGPAAQSLLAGAILALALRAFGAMKPWFLGIPGNDVPSSDMIFRG